VYRVVPPRLLGGIFSGYARLVLGRQNLHGLPKPEHSLIGAFPTVCEGLHARIANGRIAIKPAIKRFDGNRVTFSDGSEEIVDAIVYCTGYRTTFPFLSPDVFAVEDNRVRLYKRTFLPSRPGLCFIGAMQVFAPAFAPIFEVQARLVTEYINGTYALPPVQDMEKDIERELADIRRFFIHTPRHNYQAVDTLLLHSWDREIRRGRKRSNAASKKLTEGSRQQPRQAELSAAGK
jgi:dimethylaniline monooxygenase (N-oxide forming)